MNLKHAQALAAAAAMAFVAPVNATDFTWNAGGGLWSDVGFWNPVALPGGPTVSDRVFVTNNLLIETITITQNAGADSITLSDGGVVQIADSIILNNGIDFNFGGGGFLNDGHFQQNSSGADTFVQFLGDQTIAGRGDWVMSDNFNNRIIGNGGELKHGNGFGHEIRGAGQLLANTMSLWNVSTIRQQGTVALIIDPNANGVKNDGLLIAEGSGGLTLTGGVFDNTLGAIQAGNGAVTRLNSGTFVGGSFATTGSGEIRAAAATLDGITNNGTFVQQNGDDVTVVNGLTNNGTWSLNSSGADTFMQFTASQTLDGVGEVVMSDNFNNRILGSGVLTIGSQQTIRGAGQLGTNSIGIINEGTIRATGTTELLIDPNASGFEQNGILRAEGSAGLRLTTGVYHFNNAVELMTGSRLQIESSTVTGTIDVAAAEQVELRANNLQGITVNGDTLQNNSFDNTFTGGLTNNGSWSLNSTGSDTFMQFTASQTLGGVGEVVMSDNFNNRILGSGVLTIGSQQTIRGAGQLGTNSIGIINEGTILATGTTELLIDPNASGFEQNGILRAEGSAGLRLTTGVYHFNNAVELMTGSRLQIESSTVTGTIDVAAAEQVELRNNNLQGITVNGDTLQNNSFDNNFTGGLTNNGSWSLNSTGSDTFMQFTASQTLGGVGEVVMSDNFNNRILGSGVLTIGSQQTIRGAGQLGTNSIGIINEGTIRATGTTELLIDPNASGFEQNGILRAEGSAGLRLTTGVYHFNNAVELMTGSRLQIESSTVTGTIDVAAAEQVELRNNNLQGITVNGDTLQNNSFDNNFTGGLANNGAWSLNSSGADTFMQFTGTQTLGGVGEVVMSDNFNNRILGSGVLTIGSQQTIRGAGQLGVNSIGIINQGTISADATNNEILIDANASLFVNQGTLNVTGDGGLRNIGDLVQTAGHTTVDSVLTLQGGELELNGGSLTGHGVIAGTVLNSGGSVNPGNSPGTLTIDGDYVQSGAGELLIEIAGTTSGLFDVLLVGGTATLGGTLGVSLLGAPTLTVGQFFDVLEADLIAGLFDNSQVLAGGGLFDISYIDSTTDIVRLTVVAAPVPLPAALWLMLPAMLVLGAGRKKV